MSKNNFSASIEEYGFKSEPQLNENHELIKNDKNYFKEKEMFFNEKVINLDDLSLGDLTKQLSESLTKNQSIFLWSKNREIEKIKLDNDRQSLLKNRIEILRGLGDEVMHLRADAIISEKMIVLLSKMNKSKAKAELARIIEKSKTELSFYKRKVRENKLAKEELALDNKLKKARGNAEISLIVAKARMYELIRKKLKNGSIKDMPIEILHEIFNFYADDSYGSIETIAKYNKILSEVDKTKAETYKTYGEGQMKIAQSESTDLENQKILYNMNYNQVNHIE